MTTETIQGNKLIAEFMGTEPEVEYCVGHKEKQTICYSPKQTDYFPSSGMQKAECERYLKEQRERYPNGWVTKEGYETLRYEWYPRYHASWDELMPVVEKISLMNYPDEPEFVNDEDYTPDTAYPRTFGMISRNGQFMVRLNRQPLFEADTLIEAAWLAVVGFVKTYNELKMSHESPHSPAIIP